MYFVGIAIYNVVTICMLALMTTMVLDSLSLTLKYVITSGCTITASTVTMCTVFLPKVSNNSHTYSHRSSGRRVVGSSGRRVVGSSGRRVVGSSRRPVVPSSRRPVVPSSHRPVVPSSHRPVVRCLSILIICLLFSGPWDSF